MEVFVDPFVRRYLTSYLCESTSSSSNLTTPSNNASYDDEFARLEAALAAPPSLTTIRLNTLRIKSAQDAAAMVNQYLQQQDLHRNYQCILLSEYTACRVVPEMLCSDCIVIPCTGPHRIEMKTKFLIVDRKCGEAVLRGAHVFAPGVLGASKDSSFHEGDEVSILVDPTSKVHKGEKIDLSNSNYRLMAGEEGNLNNDNDNDNDNMPSAYLLHHVANGILKMDLKRIWHTERKGIAVEVTDCTYRTPPLNDLDSSLFFLQNLPSMFVAHLLQPQPNERILDMCAAPGGKTTHIAQLMRDQGEVIALERSGVRVQEIQNLQEKLGLKCIKPMKMDATCAMKRGNFQAESFDRILLDPPCSGLGLRPCLRHECTMPILVEHSRYQRKLIAEAVRLLKVGGVLVYSTCTINPMENEENVAWILDTYRDCLELDCCDLSAANSAFSSYNNNDDDSNNSRAPFVLEGLQIKPHLLDVLQPPSATEPNLRRPLPLLTDAQRRALFRFDPRINRESTGFFAARFKKTKSCVQ